MTLKIYNTLSNTKEEFIPIDEGRVGMYVCGVTVYDLCHVGHARATVVFDIIFRYLRYKGYDVTYIRNFTDIDDKIIERSNKNKCNWKDLTENYIKEFTADMSRLNVEPPTMEPTATNHIDEMIKLVSALEKKGIAYASGGDVYFSVENFKEYGLLSKKNMDDLQAGARVEVDRKKKNPLDFVLWKGSKPGEPFWESPWGQGRPGWHIECSAMSAKYLGKTFDIHGGGMDLIFPHHENEIAQSMAASGVKPVNYWIHNGFVSINNEKMSKSLGNFFTIKEILDRYNGEVLRLFLLSSHYRSPLDFSDKALDEAKERLDKFYILLRELDSVNIDKDTKHLKTEKTETLASFLKEKRGSFFASLDDDFNTALAIAYLFESLREINRWLQDKGIKAGSNEQNYIYKISIEHFKEAGDILGLFQQDTGKYFHKEQGLSREDIEAMIADRNDARKEKDWKKADEYREKLNGLGIIIEDKPDGTTLWRTK